MWRAIKRTQVPVLKESTGPDRQGEKRPDEATLTAWNVMVPDTFEDSHISETLEEAGAAAKLATANKNRKYTDLFSTHLFYPIKLRSLAHGTVKPWN